MKRVLVISDLHCGHRGGLTPPSWQYNQYDDENVRGKFGALQKTVWDWYVKKIKEVGPVDILVCNGDSIDGKGTRSGGTELLTTDRGEQCDIAAECIKVVDAKKVLLIKGTPYHTGSEEDWEDVLADKVNAFDVGFHEWVDAEGIILDFKHKTGGSTVPYSRGTAPAKEALWNLLWRERGVQEKSDIIIRSHVHYHVSGSDGRTLWMTTPALQAWSKYGTAQCSGTIDLGVTLFECNKGGYTWKPILLDLSFMKAVPLKL